MSSVFPNTSVNNPNTGSAWADGDTWNDPNSGLTYFWYNPVWKTGGAGNDDGYVKVSGDTMTGQLGLPGGGANTQAIQKQEVESLIAAIPTPPDPDLTLYVEKAGDVMTGTISATGYSLSQLPQL